jgi:hypothetical protein
MYLQSLALSRCVPKIDGDSRVIRTQIARLPEVVVSKVLTNANDSSGHAARSQVLGRADETIQPIGNRAG